MKECFYHPGIPAAGKCDICGKYVCAGDLQPTTMSVSYKPGTYNLYAGKTVCKFCAEKTRQKYAPQVQSLQNQIQQSGSVLKFLFGFFIILFVVIFVFIMLMIPFFAGFSGFNSLMLFPSTKISLIMFLIFVPFIFFFIIILIVSLMQFGKFNKTKNLVQSMKQNQIDQDPAYSSFNEKKYL